MNIFSKAAHNLPLTPGQRAFLKLLKGWIITALGAGIIAGAQLLTLGTADWQRIGLAAGGAALLSLLMAIDKYASAQGDTPLALAAEGAEQKVQQFQASLQATPPVVVNVSQPNATQPVNVGSPLVENAGTAQQPAQSGNQPVPQMPFPQATARHFGDSTVMPAVPPQQPGTQL